jgi:hypothetical protein
MIFWSFCAFIWFKNIEKMLLQMTSGFLQLESTLCPAVEAGKSDVNSYMSNYKMLALASVMNSTS